MKKINKTKQNKIKKTIKRKKSLAKEINNRK